MGNTRVSFITFPMFWIILIKEMSKYLELTFKLITILMKRNPTLQKYCAMA